MTAASARRRTSLTLVPATLAALALLGCGGGDELAPPVPVAQGSGMAVVSLDGDEVGSTPLVESGLARSQDLVRAETGEVGTFEGDPPTLTLARENPAPDNPPCPLSLSVAQTADPSVIYTAGVDYAADLVNGVLTAQPDGMGGYLVPDGTEVAIDYCYFETLFSLGVGVSLPEGDYVRILLHNLPGGMSGMRTTTAATGETPPADGSFAFLMSAAQDLSILGGARFILLNDPAVNEATVVAADLTNQLNPCVEGRAVGLVQNQRDGTEHVLEVNFDDPECP